MSTERLFFCSFKLKPSTKVSVKSKYKKIARTISCFAAYAKRLAKDFASVAFASAAISFVTLASVSIPID